MSSRDASVADVKKKLDRSEYGGNHREFLADMHLIFNNAMSYNLKVNRFLPFYGLFPTTDVNICRAPKYGTGRKSFVIRCDARKLLLFQTLQ